MLVVVLMEEIIIACFVKAKEHIIKCVLPQIFDILIYCVAKDRVIAFLPMKD